MLIFVLELHNCAPLHFLLIFRILWYMGWGRNIELCFWREITFKMSRISLNKYIQIVTINIFRYIKNHLGVQQDFFNVIYLYNKYIGNSTKFFECICMLFDLGKYVSTTQQQQNYSALFKIKKKKYLFSLFSTTYFD